MARVMVVDDDPDIAELVERRLRADGHQTVRAANGEEALKLVAEKGAPDVAVLDVTMPGMSGMELLQKLRDQLADPELPVVFLSGRVQPDDIEAGRALGARYLTKPFVASALLKAVNDCVRPPDPAGDW